MAGVLVPFFMEWGGISYMQIMILQACFMVFLLLMEVPTGAIADYFGRKISIGIGGFITSLAALVYASIPNFWVFLFGEFCWALGISLITGADDALLYDTLKKQKKERTFKKILGRYESWALFGIMIGAPIGSLIAAQLGLRFSAMFMFVPFFISMFIAFSIKEPPIKKKQDFTYFKTAINGMKYFKDHPILKILAFDMMSVSVLSFMLIWTYQPMLMKLDVPILYFGFVTAGMTGIAILVMNSFDWFEKLFKSKLRYARAMAIVSGICFILLGFSRSLILTLPCILLIAAFGIDTRRVLFTNYMHKHIESHNRATVMSTILMVFTLAQSVVYLIFGVLIEWSLSYSLMIIGLLILASIFISSVKEEHFVD
jgi:MFS family permease